MFGIEVPVHPDGCTGDQCRASLLTGAMNGVVDGPKTESGEWPEVPRAEVLLPHHRNGEIAKGPGTQREINASISPTVLHDKANEADPTKADSKPEVLRA